MNSLFDLIRREPARMMALTKAALVLAAAFFPGLAAEQREAVLTFVSVMIVVLGEGTRAMSTPNAKLPQEPKA